MKFQRKWKLICRWGKKQIEEKEEMDLISTRASYFSAIRNAKIESYQVEQARDFDK